MSERRRPIDGLWELADKAGNFVLANLLWVLLSIPLITMPIATAGLFAAMSPWARGKSAEVFQDFFGGMRQHWKKALLVGLIDLLLAGLIILNFSIFRRMNLSQPLTLLSQSVTLFVALMTIMTNLYLWPLMVAFEELPLRRLLENAVRLVFAHPAWSFAMLLLTIAPLVLSVLLLLPVAAYVLGIFSAMALITSWGAWRIIRRYVPEEQAVTEEEETVV